MNRLFDMLLGSGAIAAIVFVGLLVNILAVAFALLRYRSASQTATKLVDLALGGRADEARIQARNATREIQPLLDALGGELAPPRSRSPAREVALIALLAVWPGALCLYALSMIAAQVPDLAVLASSFLVGLAVLTPLSIAASLSVVGVGRRTARAIRGSCVTLLARQAKNAVDSEIAEALRRGGPMRDPRGE